MATPVGFEGANKVFLAPKAMGNCADLEVFQTKDEIISCWRLSDADLAEINKTGVVWLSITGHATPPVCISGEAMVQIDGKPARAEPIIPKKCLGGAKRN